MAGNSTVAALTAASALTGTELIYVVQGGNDRKATATQFQTFSSELTIGSSPITGGTTTRILYDNAGVVGEYTLSGSGTAVAMATSPSLTTPALGTPTAGVLSSCTGLPLTTGITGTLGAANGGTGVANNAASTLTISGNFATTLTVSGATGVTLPTSGTLATLAGSEELTNKTLTSSIGKGTWTASGTWALPAFTLGGTVSGGGQQLNNIIIGTSTPLAGAFTTLNASGILTTQSGAVRPVRVVSAAGAVTMLTTDFIVVVNKTVGAATTVNLVVGPTLGTTFNIKDGKGDAGTNNITITPNSGTIDGASTYVMGANYQSANVVCTATSPEVWSVI